MTVREVLLLCWRDTGHPQGGGSERYLEQVAAELAARGITVTLRTAGYRGAPRTEVRDGIRISRGGGRLTVYPRALAAIWAGRRGIGPLRGIDPDAVLDTQNGIPFFAATVAGAPTVVLVHHCHREQWPVAGKVLGRIGWWIESRLSPRVHRRNQYLTVSQPSAAELHELGIGPERVAVARAGLDPLPAGAPAGSALTRTAHPSLVVLSRLVPHKQIEHALEVLARLRGAHLDLHLDVIGDGWWAEPLRTRAAALGVTDAVTFHGHVSEQRKHQLLARAWVHLLPSRKEGWGLAVVEAAQHGVPTIGYRSSKGLTDSVRDERTGLLVGDDLAALAAAADRLLGDEDLRLRLGEQARARTAEFSWPATADGVLEVLTAAADGRRIGGVVGGRDPGAPELRAPGDPA